MIIVPIDRHLASTLYKGSGFDLTGEVNYWFLQQYDSSYGVMSDVVSDGGYWAYKRNIRTGQQFWIKRKYQSDYCINHLAFDVPGGAYAYVWSGGRLRTFDVYRMNGELKFSVCHWIRPVVSILMSNDIWEYQKLPQLFKKSDVFIRRNKLGGIDFCQSSNGGVSVLTLHWIMSPPFG